MLYISILSPYIGRGLKDTIVKELHKPARRNFPRRRTILRGIDDLWQIDLADFQKLNYQNKGYKYILVVIDGFSKFLWTVPLKDKVGKHVTEALRSILEGNRKPKNIQSDRGKEFYNSSFNELMKQYNINFYSTYSEPKASIAERVIRTLKEKIYFLFDLRGNQKWHDILESITNDYNSRVHRKIEMRPCDVINKKVEKHLLKTVYSNKKIAGPAKYKVGDAVRISKQKALFAKGYLANWTTELFKIVKVQRTNPVTYLLKDSNETPIAGAFYEQEIQKAKYSDAYLIDRVLKRSGKRLFVKWLGLDKSHNSWVDSKTLSDT